MATTKHAFLLSSSLHLVLTVSSFPFFAMKKREGERTWYATSQKRTFNFLCVGLSFVFSFFLLTLFPAIISVPFPICWATKPNREIPRQEEIERKIKTSKKMTKLWRGNNLFFSPRCFAFKWKLYYSDENRK